MNCPIDYAEDLQFVLSDNPSLNHTHISKPTRLVPHPSPSLTPSLHLMKTQISSIALLLQGCVETPIPLTLSTKPVLQVPPYDTQKVTWKDALFPLPVVPTSRFREPKLHRVQSREPQAHNSINISNSNVNSAL
jgi:hypothetical protein